MEAASSAAVYCASSVVAPRRAERGGANGDGAKVDVDGSRCMHICATRGRVAVGCEDLTSL